MTPKLIGALILAIPAILMARFVLWRRNPAIYWFAVALIAVGVGYLMATGATDDIAHQLLPQFAGPAPAKAK